MVLLGIISSVALLWWITRTVRERIGKAMLSLDFLLWESELATPIYEELVLELGDPLE
jgi:hypothetical protein